MKSKEFYLSVIIPAYNEEKFLAECLAAVDSALASVEISAEVIVVDNNSTDRTAQIAREQGARVVFESENRISRARNAGAEAARGEWYLFLDADTLLPVKLLEQIIRLTRRENVVGGGARLTFGEGVSGFGEFCMDTWNWIAETFSLAAGSLIWVESQAFEAVSGFNEAVYASEEIWFSLALRGYGRRADKKFKIIAEPPARTSCRKLEQHSPVWILAGILIFCLAPWSVFSKRICKWFWYE